MIRSHEKALISSGITILNYHRWFVDDARKHYKRRSSDPQTVREIGNFQRDLKFGKQRPLPDVPWLQDKQRTYMDDAERLYGRKETWCNIEDETVREKLASLLQDYLKDLIEAAKLEVRNARKYKRLCDRMDAEYRANVSAGAFSSSQLLRSWVLVKSEKDGERNKPQLSLNSSQEVFSSKDGFTEDSLIDNNNNDENEKQESRSERIAREKFVEARRRKGEEANLENTPATMDLLKGERQHTSYSAFPFLRQRALENETSLDPSLVDWTAKYFPEDDDRTFKSPPKLRNDNNHNNNNNNNNNNGNQDNTENEGSIASNSSLSTSKSEKHSEFPSNKLNARRRLQRSLRVHEDGRRPTFDAEGVFYRVRRQSNEDDRAPKPRAVRASDATVDRDKEVVKVPWDTLAKAKELGYSADILRAKERLIRLSRGEDPQTIP
ncbi:putative U4/U6 small nuclear ribonuclear protein [Trypanosoma theileri]|uniref:Putative U4/U6 small nuclear ribonuclear protein n=1 Tax=Trypanosoma theileri TaxID=67003 RepID=A0A1X0NYF9_9TRYP|nr:putative U4/U6 small nuclear ribonuclear protein [Trypanosoma theileri]ORC89725.1 putative U4/U6 small nuclear ribonuclear protein [Trypanosoma theileri]